MIQRPASPWTLVQAALVNTLLISVTCAVSIRAPSATKFRPAFTSVSGSATRALLHCSALVMACSCITGILMLHGEAGFALTHRAWNTQGGLHYRGRDQQPDQQFPQLYVTLLSMETDRPLQRPSPHPWPCQAYFILMHARRLWALAECPRVVGKSGQVVGDLELPSVRAPCHGFQDGWISFAAARLPVLVALSGIEGCWITVGSYHIMFLPTT